MATIEEKIVDALKQAGRPMKALDIARAIPGGYEKRDVNRVIHKMKEVERDNPGENPPLWRLCTGLSSTPPATQRVQPSFSAVDGRQGSSGPNRGGGENMLASQLSGLTIGDENTATWENKPLATIEKREDGALVVKPVPRDEIINQSSGAVTNENRPVQETATPGDSGDSETLKKPSSQKVDPINLSSNLKLKEEFEKASADNDASKEKGYTARVSPAPGGDITNSEASAQPKPSSTAVSKSKKKPKIAANFGGGPVEAQKEKILEILRQEGRPLETVEVSRRLGYETRVESMKLLEELKSEGKVYNVIDKEVSYWSIREKN